MSGYPNRAESEHDWIENSHASTALSYAHGMANAFSLRGIDGERRVVAVVGDGALTGGMAYEALNNLGHSGRRVVIVLNDNGRSYAPTVSQLSQSLTALRLNPTYTAARERLRLRLRELPALGALAYSGVHSVTSALREMVTPHTFFEALGVRYAGPIDGHDIEHMEQAFTHAAEWDGPIVVHVLTQKGRGYGPAEAGRGAAPARREGEPGRRRERRREFGRPGRREFGQFGRRRRGLARFAARDGCRRVAAAHGDVRRRFLPCAPGGGGRGLSGRRADGGHARADRTAFLPGSVPRALLRRRHRRAARGDVGGRHGHGRTAARRGGVLHLLLPGLRPGEPRRRPARVPGRLHARPGRHHRRRRAEPPWDPRHGTGAVDPRHDGVRTLGGGGDRADVAGGAGPAGPLVDSLSQGRGPAHRPGRGRTRTRSEAAAPRRRLGLPARRREARRGLPRRRDRTVEPKGST